MLTAAPGQPGPADTRPPTKPPAKPAGGNPPKAPHMFADRERQARFAAGWESARAAVQHVQLTPEQARALIPYFRPAAQQRAA